MSIAIAGDSNTFMILASNGEAIAPAKGAGQTDAVIASRLTRNAMQR